jgi:hypothetical protein
MIKEKWFSEDEIFSPKGWYFILNLNKETKCFYKWCRKNLNHRYETMPNGSDIIGVRLTHEDDVVLLMLRWS